MAIMDRYLLLRFIKVFVVFSVSLVGLYVLVDAFNNLDEFLAYGNEEGGGVGGLFTVLFAYYGPQSLKFFDLTSSLMAVIAAIFTVAMMQRSNELTAILAAGITKARVVRPLVIAAVFVSVAAVANRELLIPQYQDELSRNAQNWKGRNGQLLDPRYDNRTDILLGGKFAFADEQRISSPRFTLPKPYRPLTRELMAENAYYTPASEGRPSGYLLDKVTTPENIGNVASIYSDDQPILLTAYDTPWLTSEQCFVVSGITFEQLSASKKWSQTSSTNGLIAALRNPSFDYGSDVMVTIHGRFLRPVLDLCLFFIGLAIVLTRHQRNLFIAAGQCLLTVAAFFMVVWGFEAVGNSGSLITPAQAAWAPLMVWAPVAAVATQRLYL